MSTNKYLDNRKCIVQFCENTGRNCDLTFFQVYEDKTERWLKALQLKPNLPKKKFICSDHFELKYFCNTFKRVLLKTAVPTLQFKSPKEEGSTWDDCRETHFVWDNLNCMTNSESSEDRKPTSEELRVIANLYLASNNSERKVSKGGSSDKSIELAKQLVNSYAKNSSDEKTIEGPNSINKKEIEKTIDDYLKKRYLDAGKRKAFEVLCRTKPYKRKKKSVEDSVMGMEGSNSSVENQSSDEGNSAAETQLSTQQASTCPKQPTNFDSILKQNNINSENITKQLLEKQKLHSSSPCVWPSSVESYQTDLGAMFQGNAPNTVESNQTGIQRFTGPQPSKLVKSGDIRYDKFQSAFSFERDNEYNEFAAIVVQGLKQLKTCTSRSKAACEIQRILFEAKSGVYDI